MSYHDSNGNFVPNMDEYDRPLDVKTPSAKDIDKPTSGDN